MDVPRLKVEARILAPCERPVGRLGTFSKGLMPLRSAFKAPRICKRVVLAKLLQDTM